MKEFAQVPRFKNLAESGKNQLSRIHLEGDHTESDTKYDIFANSAINKPKSVVLAEIPS